MRLFLGIDVPEQTENELFQALLSLRLKHPDYRWIQPKNYHVTVQFFGEVSHQKDIASRLKDILYEAESCYFFTFNFYKILNKKIKLYVDFYIQKQLEKIVETVQNDLELDEKRAYLPHISVSRSALSSKQQYYALKRECEKLKIELEFKVDSLFLYESILTGKDPIYNKVAEFKLL
jgi:2'-5' RNA ligase